jgi:hypothetical protein
MRGLAAFSAMALCLLAGILTPSGSGAAMAQKRIPGTWMAGPGCGGTEWFQHPRAFPYFCDGAAYVEKAQWQGWGGASARAEATMNEAVLTAHNSVGDAPRSLSPVTVIASHVERCGNRRVYRSVVIHFDDPHKGPDKLKLPTYLPCKPPATQAGPSKAAEFLARPAGGFISCGMYAEAGAKPQVVCQGIPKAGQGEDPLEQIAKLHPDGQVVACSQPLSAGDNHCDAGNAGERIPTYAAGKRVKVGPFACEVLEAGVECTVVASGKGFLITPSEIAPVSS